MMLCGIVVDVSAIEMKNVRRTGVRRSNICIPNRSKLRVERTRKSLARNSRVLSGFCYVVYTQ